MFSVLASLLANQTINMNLLHLFLFFSFFMGVGVLLLLLFFCCCCFFCFFFLGRGGGVLFC